MRIGLRSLRSKVILPLAVAAGLLALAFIATTLLMTRRQLKEERQARAALLTDAVVYAAEAAASAGSLQTVVASLEAHRDVLDVAVVAGEPLRVLAAKQRSWLGHPISVVDDPVFKAHLLAAVSAHEPRAYTADRQAWFDYSAPIQIARAGHAPGEELRGSVLLRMDVRPLRREMLHDTQQLMFVLSMGMIAFVWFAYRRLDRIVLSPLSALLAHISHARTSRDQPWPEEQLGDELAGIATNLRAALHDRDQTFAQLEYQKFALDQHSIVAVTDVRGRISYVNDKFCAISKYSREEVIGNDHRILNSRHHPKTFFTQMWRTLLRGEVWNGEIRNRAKDGELYWVDTTIVPWKGPNGKPTQFIAIRTDVTEKKQAEQALREAKASAETAYLAKSAFLANMSHEIRTPMNAIIGLTGLLTETPLNPKQREFLDIVRSSSESLLDLLNDVLDYSKIEANKIELETTPFDLRKMLDSIIDLFGVQFASKHLDLVASVADDVPDVVLGDATRFRQILVNLVSNAMKFTARGEVEVTVECRGCAEGTADLHLSVRDTGIGIAPEKIETLFQPFTQIDGSTTRRFGGSGLGLAICKRFADLMSGKLWLESAPGQGSTFHFQCPLTAAGRERRRPPVPSLQGQRILVVDDNAACRGFVVGELEKRGADVVGTATFEHAVELLAEGKAWSLVVADDPTTQGAQAMEEIRRRIDRTDLPLVVMSANLAAAANEAVLTVCVTKPLKVAPLLAAVERALRISGAPQLPPTTSGRTEEPFLPSPMPLRILLVEDNPVNQKLASLMLERLGYHATIAHDGRQAVEAVAAEGFDLILMDVHMPELDGMQATREIRRLSLLHGHRPRIVALTASVLAEERAAANAAGMDDFLAKPLRASELIRVINSCDTQVANDTQQARRLADEHS